MGEKVQVDLRKVFKSTRLARPVSYITDKIEKPPEFGTPLFVSKNISDVKRVVRVSMMSKEMQGSGSVAVWASKNLNIQLSMYEIFRVKAILKALCHNIRPYGCIKTFPSTPTTQQSTSRNKMGAKDWKAVNNTAATDKSKHISHTRMSSKTLQDAGFTAWNVGTQSVFEETHSTVNALATSTQLDKEEYSESELDP